MLLGGDELGRTQDGNNNAYCQDNELSWFDWDDVDDEFLDWCRQVTHLRRQHPVFRRRRWFQGRQIRGIEDLAWFRPDGEEMTEDDWETGYAQSVGVFLNGESIPTTDAYGGRIVDDSFFVCSTPASIDLPWTLPSGSVGAASGSSSSTPTSCHEPGTEIPAGGSIDLAPRSMVVLRAPRPTAADGRAAR